VQPGWTAEPCVKYHPNWLSVSTRESGRDPNVPVGGISPGRSRTRNGGRSGLLIGTSSWQVSYHDWILITAKDAPSGSARTAKRPGGMSVGGTSVVAPTSVALETEASVSSTPK